MIRFPDRPEQYKTFAESRMRELAHPPMPLPLDHPEGPQPLMTSQWVWIQPPPDFEAIPPDSNRMTPHESATIVEGRGNPLRQLAAELLTAADQMDRDGVVPVGINVQTEYIVPYSSVLGRDRVLHKAKCAVVVFTTRGVRREWLDANRAVIEREIEL